MLVSAQRTAIDNGIKIVAEIWVPGSYEVPLVVKRLLQDSRINGAVVLGIIERGETHHGLTMGQTVSDALIRLQLEFMKPIGIGILGPDILPSQISARLESYAATAVHAVNTMLSLSLWSEDYLSLKER
jgi:6,7-dimethyl-8-ribityllumazine synthase